MIDKDLYERWQAALELNKAQQKSWGIGTLREKPVHAAIKYTVEPNDSYHEVRIGSFVADVVTEQGIVEVQTRSLHSLKKKLAHFLEQGKVTVIHPMAQRNYIAWVDEESGEVTAPRRSSHSKKPYDSFYELMYLRELLLHPNLSMEFWMLDVEEYRFLNGYGKDKKSHATRYQQMPKDLLDIVRCHCGEDFLNLLPEVPEVFTRKQLKDAAKRTDRWAQRAIYTLEQMNLLERAGKEKNAILYRKCCNKSADNSSL